MLLQLFWREKFVLPVVSSPVLLAAAALSPAAAAPATAAGIAALPSKPAAYKSACSTCCPNRPARQ